MNVPQNLLNSEVIQVDKLASGILIHTIKGEISNQLSGCLEELSSKIDLSSPDSIIREIPEGCENLVITFPDNVTSQDPGFLAEQILGSSFKVIQKFVQVRMKKRFGQILCLVNASANGLLYDEESNSLFSATLGGLSGLIKTVSKEYSKRGIIANVIYIDWKTVPVSEVASRVISLLKNNNNLKGQVFALDGGKWL
jgi:hypothetical protein